MFRPITRLTALLRRFAVDRILLRLDVVQKGSFVRSRSGQESIMCLTVWFECPHEQFGVTFGTR